MRTLKADKQEAEVEVNALLEGKAGKSGKTVIALFDEAGKKVAEQTVSGATPEIKTTLKVANPQLWSPESPYLYQVKLTRYEGKKVDADWNDGTNEGNGNKYWALNEQVMFNLSNLFKGYRYLYGSG